MLFANPIKMLWGGGGGGGIQTGRGGPFKKAKKKTRAVFETHHRHTLSKGGGVETYLKKRKGYGWALGWL